MTTTRKLNRQAIEAIMEVDAVLASPLWRENLNSNSDNPLLSSKGAGSVHALRRRAGKGWCYLGFAV